jgi:hypothetical protein
VAASSVTVHSRSENDASPRRKNASGRRIEGAGVCLHRGVCRRCPDGAQESVLLAEPAQIVLCINWLADPVGYGTPRRVESPSPGVDGGILLFLL